VSAGRVPWRGVSGRLPIRPSAKIGLLAAALLTAALVSLTGPARAADDEAYPGATERMRNRIESAGVPPVIMVGEEPILAGPTAALFYERRGWAPAWTTPERPLSVADSLVVAIRSCRLEGLRASDYHLEAIESALGDLRAAAAAGDSLDPGAVVDFELLATDAFLLVASHYLSGRLDPETIDPEWFAARRGADFAAILEDSIAWNAIRGVLAALLPADPGYARLRDALAEYRRAAAARGWPVIPGGETLKSGAEGARVAALRERLRATGDLAEISEADSAAFDPAVELAVQAFQRRHGLDADGVVGAVTLSALNVPVEERVRELVVNLERWRWLPQETGDTHVIINIADFTLRLVAPDREQLVMRVIVGRDYRRTPVFSGEIMYLVLNPRWEVPRSIAVKDILPEAQKDPGYFERMGMRVLVGWGADEEEIDPATVDWPSIRPEELAYRFQQRPGPQNALGRVKFMFPNRFNVYLHDTPSTGLFARSERAFSSGCIRVEQPIELAERLLAPDPGWDRGAIVSAIERGDERTVVLPKPVPVHVLYWTAWADDDGAVNFRRDIYGRDGAVAQALAEPPPEAPPLPGDEAPDGGGP
jgi:murein L,D-transpeptidase YcbB/YkuD